MTTAFVDRYCRVLIAFPFLCFLSSCSLYSVQAITVRDALMANQIDYAYSLVEAEGPSSDAVLKNLNKGILQRMKQDFSASNHALENAKKRIARLYGISVTEQLGSVVINDSVIAYKGVRFEQLLLHAYMAMNYIEMGDLDAARVEMLQADVKMHEWGDKPDDDPFIKYMAGMIYEALDENDQAIVSYRDAMQAYKANRDKQNLDVPRLLISDLIRLLEDEGLTDESLILQNDYSQTPLQIGSDQGVLIVILNHGLAPIKLEHSITTFADEIEQTVRIALPVYAIGSERLKVVRIVINGGSALLETVENIDGLARSALEEDMPLILTRAIARAIIKHKLQHEAKDDQSMGGFLITITNLVTERADTRSWTTLPQEIQMSRHSLASGEHNLAIEFVNKAGFVVDRIQQNVLIRSGEITFVFKHWVSPRAKPEQNPTLPSTDVMPVPVSGLMNNAETVTCV